MRKPFGSTENYFTTLKMVAMLSEQIRGLLSGSVFNIGIMQSYEVDSVIKKIMLFPAQYFLSCKWNSFELFMN